MFEEIRKREPGRVAGILESGVQLFAEGGVERTVDEVVGLFHTNLTACLGEELGPQVIARPRRPIGEFGVEQFRRPAAPRERAPSDRKNQPTVVEGRVIHPRYAQIWCAAHERHILHMFGQNERAGLEHEDASAACAVGDKKMFRGDGAERASADHNHVEIASPSRNGLRRAVDGFLQRVAQKPPHVVQGERSGLRAQQWCHGIPRFLFPPVSTGTTFL